MSQTVELKVGMSCQGCVGAVKRVLGKLEGVESFDIDIEKQKVTVKGNVQPDVVFQTISKTGKATSFWEAPPAAAQPPAAEPPAAAQPPAAEPPAAAQPPAAEPPAVAQPPPAEPEQLPTETISAA